MWDGGKKQLIGLKLVEILSNRSKTCLRLLVEYPTGVRGYKYLVAEGDCCSESWIEYIGFTAWELYGNPILKIDENYIGEGAPTRQDSDKLYSTTFKFSTGELIIEYRNSSNGYYGGWLVLEDRESEIDSDEFLPWKEVFDA